MKKLTLSLIVLATGFSVHAYEGLPLEALIRDIFQQPSKEQRLVEAEHKTPERSGKCPFLEKLSQLNAESAFNQAGAAANYLCSLVCASIALVQKAECMKEELGHFDHWN